MFELFLFTKNIDNQTEKNAQQDAGCQWEVKGKAAAPDPDIARKSTQVEEPKKVRIVQQQPRRHQQKSCND
jgi:hypothetical protein